MYNLLNILELIPFPWPTYISSGVCQCTNSNTIIINSVTHTIDYSNINFQVLDAIKKGTQFRILAGKYVLN